MPDHHRFPALNTTARLVLLAIVTASAVTGAVGLSGCATMRAEAVAAHQEDWDILRLKAVRQLGTLIESYKDAKGHYPLADARWNNISPIVYIGPKDPHAAHQASGFRGDAVVLSADLFAKELSRGLGWPVTLPTDPGPGSDKTKPTYYRYQTLGTDYQITVYTDGAFPFTQGRRQHELNVGSNSRRTDALHYPALMADDRYILASTRSLAHPEVTGTERPLPPASPGDELLFAIANDNLGQMRQALAARAPLNPVCAPGEFCNPLALAARVAGLKTVARLLDAGADPNGADGNGDTALLLAANHHNQTESTKIRRLLLEHGADPNQGNRWGWTPFSAFSAAGELPLMKLALGHGADVNMAAPASGVEGITHGDPPLVAAARFGKYDAVRWLLKHGADPRLAGYDGKTAHQVATALNNRSILNLLEP